MASIQIPNLPAVTSLSGDELLEAVQGGTSVKVGLNQVAALIQSGSPQSFPLQVSIGGTGATTSTGYGSVVLSDGPTVSFAAGSVDAPSVAFLDDSNTGVWSPDSDTVAVSTGGAQRLTVDSFGNVGIGTDTSPHRLTIVGPSGEKLVSTFTSQTAPSSYVSFSDEDTSAPILIGSTGNSFVVHTSGSERLQIHASGGVSVGGSSDPGATNLLVAGGGSFGTGTASLPSIAFNGDLNTGIWSPSGNNISISTDGVERLRVGANGEIGIGGGNYGTLGQAIISGGPSVPPAWGVVGVNGGGTGITSYGIGDIIVAAGPTALSKVPDVIQGNALISGGVGATPTYGKIGLTTHISGILPLENGGTGAISAPEATSALLGYRETNTSGGTTVLNNTSSRYQRFFGGSTETITLPDVATLKTGWSFNIDNNSTGVLTLNSSGGNLVSTIKPGLSVTAVCISISGTNANSWSVEYTGFNGQTGSGSVVMSNDPELVSPIITSSRFSGGSAGLPSISFNNDPNTGVWSPAADTIAVSTNGIERLRVNQLGGVSTLSNRTGYGAVAGESAFYLSNDGTPIGPITSSFFSNNSSLLLESNSVYKIELYVCFRKNVNSNVIFNIATSVSTKRVVGYYIGALCPSSNTLAAGHAASQGSVETNWNAASGINNGSTYGYIFNIVLHTDAETSFNFRVTQGNGTLVPLAGSYYSAKKISGTIGSFE